MFNVMVFAESIEVKDCEMLRPATMNHDIVKQKREEERIRLENEKRETIAKILPALISLINKTADNGETWVSINWHDRTADPLGINWLDWYNYGENIAPILKNAGYKLHTVWYSDGWRRKSGKIGYLTISWL